MNEKTKTFLDLVEEVLLEDYYKAKVKVEDNKVVLEIENSNVVSSLKNVKEVYISIHKEKPQYKISELKWAISELFKVLIRESLTKCLSHESAEDLIKIIKWARGEKE